MKPACLTGLCPWRSASEPPTWSVRHLFSPFFATPRIVSVSAVPPAQCLIAAKNSTPARFRKHFFTSDGAQMPFFSVFAHPPVHCRGVDFRCGGTAKRVFRNSTLHFAHLPRCCK